MTQVLVDYHMEGQAELIWSILASEGWLELIPLQLVRFRDVDLHKRSNDRVVWRFAQQNRMLLLTNNRNMEGSNSLEQTLRKENGPASLPVLTIANLHRLSERPYRVRCAANLLDIVVDLDNYLGQSKE
ncbi:MAG: hypothetical protein R3E79_57460 [Caldilineaceae bacterium]